LIGGKGVELARKLTKKRSLIGYSEKETRMAIDALQTEHQKEVVDLNEAIQAEIDKNQSLKDKLVEIKEQPINMNQEEELTLVLKNHFFEQTRSILVLQGELEEKRNLLKQSLENKIQQKELAQKRVQAVLDYFNQQKMELEKELIK
jgi:hypothetical protein